MKKILFLILFFGGVEDAFSQKTDIGVFLGRFYAIYEFKDYGTGFRNLPASQYSVFPTITVNKKYSEKISGELRASFMPYKQNTATRLYAAPAFAWNYSGGNISLTANYTFISAEKFESRIKAGMAVCFFPDKYQGGLVLTSVNPPGDSVSRGRIKRDYSTFFPSLCTGLDFSYEIAKRVKISLAASYQKGFSKITEYDIYYNDGSGSNDQRARQWGKGDFYGVQMGVRYQLRDEKGQKSGKNK